MPSGASNKKLSLETNIWVIALHVETSMSWLFSNELATFCIFHYVVNICRLQDILLHIELYYCQYGVIIRIIILLSSIGKLVPLNNSLNYKTDVYQHPRVRH